MPSWVYMIISKNNDEKIYIGSTTGKYFCLRKGGHTRPSTTKSGRQPQLYGYITDNGGWECFKFEILKEYENIDKKELLTIEKEYIKTFNPKCNRFRPIKTQEEKLEDNKNKSRLHRQRHPDYLQKNKERQSHKDYVKKRCSTIIECECGGRYTLQNKTNHFSRNIHKEYENKKDKTTLNSEISSSE